MGAIRVIKSDDGKPYISLEDFLNELENLKDSPDYVENGIPEFLDTILNILHEMEQEYYTKTFILKSGTINPQGNKDIKPVPANIPHAIDDPEAALMKELLQSFKLPKRKLNKEQSKIADEIDGIAGTYLTLRKFESPEELDTFRTKMVGLRTICSRANLKYENWTMLVEAVQKKTMTKDEILMMIQQRIQNGQSKNAK